jgi:hypothetical protein
MEMNIHCVAQLGALGRTPAATCGSPDRRSALENDMETIG